MAYFSNGNEGMCLDEQCNICRYGEDSCPIFYVQINWNYEACNNKTAREILDHLICNCGICRMFELFEKDLKIDAKDQDLPFGDMPEKERYYKRGELKLHKHKT